MKYKHILWDWNGTLLDDVWVSVKSINVILNRYKIDQITICQYLEIFTFPVIDYYKKIGFNFKKDPFEKIGTEFILEYTKNQFLPDLHTNSFETLSKIKALEVPQSIVSAATQKMLDKMMKHHKLTNYFKYVVGQDNHYAYGKEEKVKELIKIENIKPSEVLYIGDTIHDFDVAGNLRIDCLLLSHGHTSYTRLLKTGAHIFNDMETLCNWIENNI